MLIGAGFSGPCPDGVGSAGACLGGRESREIRAMAGKKRVYKGRVFEVWSEPVSLPSGRRAGRDVVRHPGSVAVLPVDERGRVLLLRQFRHAVGGVIWEIPAGTLEPGERPLLCARRELLEETGYRARRWKKLTTIYASPGILDERLHLYAAWDLTRGTPRPQADEDIVCRWVSMERALSMVRSGRLADSKSICAVLYVTRFGLPAAPFETGPGATGKKR